MSSIGQLLRVSAIPAIGGAIGVYINENFVVPQIPTIIVGGLNPADNWSMIILWLTNAAAILLGVSLGTLANRSLLD